MPRTRVPRQRVFAERTHCEAAVTAALDNERQRFRAFAAGIMRGVRGPLSYMDEDDLVQEAVLATLNGTRGWEPAQVECSSHLYGCIKGIRHTHVKKAFNRKKFEQEFERQRALHEPDTRDLGRFYDHVRMLLKDDVGAVQVLNLRLEGKSPAEIRVTLNITATDYTKKWRVVRHQIKRRRCARQSIYRRSGQRSYHHSRRNGLDYPAGRKSPCFPLQLRESKRFSAAMRGQLGKRINPQTGVTAVYRFASRTDSAISISQRLVITSRPSIRVFLKPRLHRIT